MLTAELRAIETLRAEILPEETFGGSLFTTEAADIVAQLVWCAHDDKLYLRIQLLMEDDQQRQNPELRTLSDPARFSLAAKAKIAPGHLPQSVWGRNSAVEEQKKEEVQRWNYFNRVYSRVGFSYRMRRRSASLNSGRSAVNFTVFGNRPSKCG